ncbi:MAG: thioredoxin domain-containing protein [Chthoniobacterales bacterium]
MKRYLPFILIVLVAAITGGAGTMLLRAKQRVLANAGGLRTPSGNVQIKPLHVSGPASAPVTIEEFGDFQCPSCANTSSTIRELAKDYGGRLRVVFWHFPLALHRHGREAALAAEAASLQGRFWEMHDALYENQSSWSRSPDVGPLFNEYAVKAGLNVARFRKDMDSPEVAARVDQERNYGTSRGVQRTPTLFIKDQEFPPPFTPERLRERIDAALAAAKSS